MTVNNFSVIQDLCINDVTVSSSAYSKSENIYLCHGHLTYVLLFIIIIKLFVIE